MGDRCRCGVFEWPVTCPVHEQPATVLTHNTPPTPPEPAAPDRIESYDQEGYARAHGWRTARLSSWTCGVCRAYVPAGVQHPECAGARKDAPEPDEAFAQRLADAAASVSPRSPEAMAAFAAGPEVSGGPEPDEAERAWAELKAAEDAHAARVVEVRAEDDRIVLGEPEAERVTRLSAENDAQHWLASEPAEGETDVQSLTRLFLYRERAAERRGWERACEESASIADESARLREVYATSRLTLEVARLTRWRNLWRACARQLYRSLRAGTQLHVARGRELERLAAERDAWIDAMVDAETLLRRVSYRQDAPPRWSEECRRAADRLAAVLSGT